MTILPAGRPGRARRGRSSDSERERARARTPCLELALHARRLLDAAAAMDCRTLGNCPERALQPRCQVVAAAPEEADEALFACARQSLYVSRV